MSHRPDQEGYEIIDGYFAGVVENISVVKTHLSERYKMISKCVEFPEEVFVHFVELYSKFDLGSAFFSKFGKSILRSYQNL